MIKPIFEEEDYKNIDFTKDTIILAEYENCLFSNCKFSATDLSGYSFVECQFINCDLSNIVVDNSIFRDTSFKDCKLLGIQFNTCNELFFSIKCDNCQLNLASFYQRKLKNCCFTNSHLNEVDFAEANLSSVMLKNCDLSHAIFDETNLNKADLTDSYNFSIDPENNIITKAKFSRDQLLGLLGKHNIIVSQ